MRVSWWEYVQEVAGTTNQTEIARRTGLTQPSVNRWRSVSPRPENVVAFARAYNRPALEAFKEAGFLTDEDVLLTEVQADVDSLSTDDLTALLHRIGDELRRRIPG